jgi:hypothetical protein
MDPSDKSRPAQRGFLRNPLLFAIPILIGLFVTRSPYLMAATAPSEGKPWADVPIALVTTPQYATKQVWTPLTDVTLREVLRAMGDY